MGGLMARKEFRSMDVSGHCLTNDRSHGWALQPCHDRVISQWLHFRPETSKWCNRRDCVEESTIEPVTTTQTSTTTQRTWPTTTKAPVGTSTSKLTSTTTAFTSTTSHGIQGLTPEEVAVYNPDLASYWDFDHCGKASDNHNIAWCGHENKCKPSVVVSETICQYYHYYYHYNHSGCHRQ